MARVEVLADGKNKLYVDGLSFIMTDDTSKDVVFALCKALGFIAIEDEDIKKMIRAIESKEIPKSIDISNATKIPIVGTTTDNNNFKRYTGDKIPTETLMELNKTLKKHS